MTTEAAPRSRRSRPDRHHRPRSRTAGALLGVALLTLPGWLLLVSPSASGTTAGDGAASTVAGPSFSPSASRTVPTCSVRTPGAGFIAYDAANNMTYATDTGSVVVFDRVCHIAGYIALPPGATGQQLSYDPANGDVYVAESPGPGVGGVAIINGSKVVATVGNVTGAYVTVYDAALGGIAVNNGSNVTVLVGTKVALNIPAAAPYLGYAPLNGGILALIANVPVCSGFVCHTNHVLELVNATTGQHLKSIPLRAGGGRMTYDPFTQRLYMCNGNALDVIDPVLGTIAHAIGLGYTCETVVYSYAMHSVLAISGSSNQVDVVTSQTVVAHVNLVGASGMFAAAYDLKTAAVYIPNAFGHQVFVVHT